MGVPHGRGNGLMRRIPGRVDHWSAGAFLWFAVLLAGLLGPAPAVARARVLHVTAVTDDGPGSLRQALAHANAAPGPDTIEFALAGPPQGTGRWRIVVGSALPAVTDPVSIRGPLAPDGSPLVEIAGAGPGAEHGLRLRRRATVSGVAIGGFRTGVTIEPGASGTVLTGSHVGAGPDGLPPNGTGVVALAPAVIGGLAPGDANAIRGNLGDGIEVVAPAREVVIRGNSISANSGHGVDLESDPARRGRPGGDPDVPDAFDGDGGANDSQNAPVLVTATLGGPGEPAAVGGLLSSRPSHPYAVDVYASGACDDSAFGEGERWIGEARVTTDAAGLAAFTVSAERSAVLGEWITATATGPDGTSEFSACTPVMVGASAPDDRPPPGGGEPPKGGGTGTGQSEPAAQPSPTADTPPEGRAGADAAAVGAATSSTAGGRRPFGSSSHAGAPEATAGSARTLASAPASALTDAGERLAGRSAATPHPFDAPEGGRSTSQPAAPDGSAVPGPTPSPRGQSRLGGAVPLPTRGLFGLVPLAQVLALSTGLVLLLGFSSAMFNETLKANRDVVDGWFRWLSPVSRAAASRLAVVPPLLLLAGVNLTRGTIFSLADPGFPTAEYSLGLWLGLTLGGILVVILAYGSVLAVERRRCRRWGRVRAVPVGLLVALGCVALSRSFAFLPGYLYGATVALVLPAAIPRRREGLLTAIGYGMVLAGAVGAFFARGLLAGSLTAPEPVMWATVLDTALVFLAVGGSEYATFALLPMQGLDGAAVMAWSRRVWAALLSTATFLFVFIALHPASGLWEEGSWSAVVGLAGAFGGFSIAFWAYFRFVRRPPGPPPPMDPPDQDGTPLAGTGTRSAQLVGAGPPAVPPGPVG